MMAKTLLCGLVTLLPAALGFVVPTASSSAFARGSGVAHVSATTAPSAVSRPTMAMERSYIMIKPDGVQRGLVGKIITRFEERGYKLAGLKLKQADEALLKKHYNNLAAACVCMRTLPAPPPPPPPPPPGASPTSLSVSRKMLGETNPLASAPGTIRGDFCLEVMT
ncbi:unnamed protein product [Ectocarpus sp. 8 AP-2014]